MQSQLSNPLQRAQHRIAGKQPVDILIETVADQNYKLIAYVTNYFQVKSLATILASGTVNVTVKRIRAGVTATVAGLSALASSSTRAEVDADGDETSLFIPGDQLLITTDTNSAGVDLSVTISTQPMGSG
ncbi:MAG: hypothetical protein ACSLEZ_00190 [Thiobacillus sp.]